MLTKVDARAMRQMNRDFLLASVAKHATRGEGIPIVPSSVGDDIMVQGAVLLAMEGQ